MMVWFLHTHDIATDLLANEYFNFWIGVLLV